MVSAALIAVKRHAYEGQARRSLAAVSGALQMDRMKDSAVIRYDNLLALIAEAGGQSALAERVGTSAVYISQVVNKSVDAKTGRPWALGAAMARRIEEAFDKPRGWMDHDHANLLDVCANEDEVALLALYRALPPEAAGKALGFMQGLAAARPASPNEDSRRQRVAPSGKQQISR